MACDYWKIEEDKHVKSWYDDAMLAFSYIYYTEASLKIGALGLDYFRDNWCRFDFFLVCTTLIDQYGSKLLEFLPFPPMLFRVLRIFRILRILRILKDKRAKGLRDLLMTMMISFPALINVGSLLALLIFMFAARLLPLPSHSIYSHPTPSTATARSSAPEYRRYAVLGVQLFTFVRHDEEILTDDRNFDDFGHALLTLFQAREQSPTHRHHPHLHPHLHLHLPHPPRELSVTSPLMFPELDGRRLVGDDARVLHPPT